MKLIRLWHRRGRVETDLKRSSWREKRKVSGMYRCIERQMDQLQGRHRQRGSQKKTDGWTDAGGGACVK